MHEMNLDSFISYSQKDKKIADEICLKLEASGIRCWIAPRNIVGGEKWADAIKRGIKKAGCMVLVLTSNSNTSQEVLNEVKLAVEAEIPIIPFRVHDILPSESLDRLISRHQWLDAFNPPLEKRIDELIDSLCRLLHIVKKTEIPDYAETLRCGEEWKFSNLVPNNLKESTTIDAISVLGTDRPWEEGAIVLYHLDGVVPTKLACLNVRVSREDVKRVRWLYSCPDGREIKQIAYSTSYWDSLRETYFAVIHLKEIETKAGDLSKRVITLEIGSGAEIATKDTDCFHKIRWRKVRDLNPTHGDSTAIQINGLVLEMSTLKNPLMKFRWVAPISEIAMVSPVNYPLMDSHVLVICYDLSLHYIHVAKSDYSIDEFNWYKIKHYADSQFGLELQCNKCNEISTFYPRDGYSPGRECPKCKYPGPKFNLYGW